MAAALPSAGDTPTTFLGLDHMFSGFAPSGETATNIYFKKRKRKNLERKEKNKNTGKGKRTREGERGTEGEAKKEQCWRDTVQEESWRET